MTMAESSSKTTCLSLISLAKKRALWQANASMTATELDRGVGIDNAPIASPLLSRMITPIPAEELSLKTVHRNWLCNTGTLGAAIGEKQQLWGPRSVCLEQPRTPEVKLQLLGRCGPQKIHNILAILDSPDHHYKNFLPEVLLYLQEIVQ